MSAKEIVSTAPKTFEECGPKQKVWIEALESGKYEQTTGSLRSEFLNGSAYCCLGLFCALEGYEREGSGRYIYPDFEESDPDRLSEISHNTLKPGEFYSYLGSLELSGPQPWKDLGLYSRQGDHYSFHYYYSLAFFNDTSHNFIDIAKLLRNNPSHYFREPK